MEPEILLIGEALIDVVRRVGQPVKSFPGGSPLNVAVGLGRLGHRPTLATWYARDEGGQAIEAHLAASHVAVLPGSDQASRTTVAAATIDQTGHASYTFDVDADLPAIVTGQTPQFIHTGSLGAILDPGCAHVLAFLEQVGSQAIISFDPNCRPSIMGPVEPVRAKVERYVRLSHLVKVSDEDLAWLYPEAVDEAGLIAQARRWLSGVDSPEETLVNPLQTPASQTTLVNPPLSEIPGEPLVNPHLGPSLVVVTTGATGALVITGQGDCWRIPADSSHGLVDTVGAGDSFMAGIIHGLVTQGCASPESYAALVFDRTALTAILTQAAAIAGLTVSRAGANPPWLAELAELEYAVDREPQPVGDS